MVGDWPTHFADAFNKYKIRKSTVENIEWTRNLTIDNKIKEALIVQLTKEKVVQLQLSVEYATHPKSSVTISFWVPPCSLL